MSYERLGQCEQCGQCCMFDTIARFMLNLTQTRCKYLIKKNGIYDCEITGAKFENLEDSQFIELIPVKDYNYWKNECQPYPDSTNKDHRAPFHQLYPLCSYTITKVG